MVHKPKWWWDTQLCGEDFILLLCPLPAFGEKNERYVFAETEMVLSGGHPINKKCVLNRVICFRKNLLSTGIGFLTTMLYYLLHPQISSLNILDMNLSTVISVPQLHKFSYCYLLIHVHIKSVQTRKGRVVGDFWLLFFLGGGVGG